MNYRTMVKGALAFSLSLIVGSSWAAQTTQTDVPAYGATFESAVSTVAPLNDFAYTEGDGITNAKYRVTQDVEKPYGWFPGSEEDESKIITANGGQALQLNTDASTLTNQFEATKAADLNAAIAAAGAYFETDVKFVASDTPDAGIEGGTDATKFAIYAYCDEEAETVTTNLVVYHAYQDYDDESLSENNYIGYTNEVFATLIDTEVYTKLRIEMRQIDDNGTQRNLFSVSVNGGDPIASTEGLAYEDGIWFLTVENSLSDAAREVSSFNFKGTGEIDNISVGVIDITTKVATVDGTDYATWADALAAIHDGSVVTAYEDGTIDLASGTITLNKNGFNVTVTTSTQGKKIQDNGDGTYTVVDDYTAATVFTVAGNVTNTIGNYATLAEALAAATDGATVLVLNDLTLDARVEPNVGANTAITIDLGGKTITRTGTTGNGSVFDVKSGDVIITNGVIVCTQDDTAIVADGVYAITSRNGSNVTLADLVVLVNSECGACAYPFAGSTMTIESGAYSNLTQTVYRYNTAITGMAVNQPNIADQLLIIKGGTFSQYDPQLGDDSGAMADFTDDGFVAISDGNGGWVVQPGYNVTFDADGGTPVPEAQRVAAGGTATAPTAPDKEGFTFGGWTLNGAAFDFDTVLDADIALVASWTEVVNATVISVAKLSATGAMVNDAAPALTATVTDSDGETVDAADYTIDASAIDMRTAGLYPVIITATGAGYAGTLTNYYAVMSLTWFNGTPTQKALINPQNMTLTGAHYMHTTEDGAYLAIGASNGNGTGWGHALYSVATLTSIYGTCQGVWEVAHFTSGGGKGMTANTTSGIMLNGGGSVGGTVATQSTFKGYDIGDLANIGTSSNMVQETYTAEWDGSGYAAGQIMDGIDFNHAGTKVFGNNAGTDGPWVYQLAIDKAAKTMTWEATYTTPFARVRSVTAYYIDGKDYIFVGEGASSGKGEIAVIDPSDGSIKTICVAADDFTTAEFPASRYFTNVKVSGIASGEMYLYGCTDKGEVVVWALGHDAVTGEWKTAPVGNITSAQTAALNSKASVGNCRAFEVSDDNNAGFLYVQSSPGQFAVVTDISLAQRKALASATLTPAGSDKDVALGAITATVLDENGATVAASEYTITTNGIDIATAGEYTVTITPVEGSVYSNAVTAVYTISEPAAGYNYPEGGAIEDAAVVAWLTAKGFTQAQVTALTTNAKLNECYLLNCDISQAGAGGSIAITAITVDAQGVHVTVALTRTAGIAGGINGTLKLQGTADLATAPATLTEGVSVENAKFTTDSPATATFTGSGAKFFKAVIE